MKKKIILALCSLLIAGGGIGISSIPHKEMPVSQELLAETLEEEVTEEIVEEEIAEVQLCQEGCTLEEGHEGECVMEAELIEVILKSTSMERDLKVKFVSKASGKVISGADFKMKLTDPSKKTKEYSDHDQDGIIWVKDIDGGNYTVEMLELEGYVTAKNLTAEVKKKIEYKVVEVVDEVKTESQVVVSKEDAQFGGTNKDESTTSSNVPKDTVEYVASTKKEVVTATTTQKKDAFGQLVYEKQKKDVLGQPMYAKILSESDEFHTYNDGNTCTRCGASKSPVQNPGDVTPPEGDNSQSGEGTTPPEGDNSQSGEGTTPPGGDNSQSGEETTPPEGDDSQSGEGTTPPEGDNSQSGDANTVSNDGTDSMDPPVVVSILFRRFHLLRASASRFINYDTTSAPVYDTASNPVYETEVTYVYTGWQTIDGATYYFDKNGKKVTGSHVIEGVQYTFSSEGVRSGTIGIDVSKYQPTVDWKKVKNAGINFVMIRCGYRGYGSGVLVEDSMYKSHITGAKAAGLRVGVYFFSQAINEAEAVEEASMAVALAKKYGINMPIAIDSEYAAGGSGRADKLSKAERTAVTKAFCDTVKSAGYTPMVYASKSWFSDHLNMSQLSGYRIWVAHYAEKCGYKGTYHIWQNTDKGKVDGIPGYVDMNIGFI